jgi:hypothetical protein
MKITTLLALFTVLFIASSCGDDEVPANKFMYPINLDFDHGLANYNSYRVGDNAHSGKVYSRADSAVGFGFYYSYILPDSMVGKNIMLDLEAWVRTGDLSNYCDLIASARGNDSVVLWLGCGARQAIKAANEWTFVKTNALLPSTMTSKNNFIVEIMAHNIDAKSYFDVDDVKIKFTEQN